MTLAYLSRSQEGHMCVLNRSPFCKRVKSLLSSHRRKPNREWGKALSGVRQEKPMRWIILEVAISFRKGSWIEADNGAAILHSRNWDPWASTKPNWLQKECGCLHGMAPLLASSAGKWTWSTHLEAPHDHICASVSQVWSLLEQEYLYQVQHCPLARHLITSLFAGERPMHAVFTYKNFRLNKL